MRAGTRWEAPLGTDFPLPILRFPYAKTAYSDSAKPTMTAGATSAARSSSRGSARHDVNPVQNAPRHLSKLLRRLPPTSSQSFAEQALGNLKKPARLLAGLTADRFLH